MNDTINLYDEIIEVLKRNNRAEEDISWVVTRDATIDKAIFLEGAKKIDYDNGYGGTEIATDLIVVGDNWWLSREEYDGSEWWEYNAYPKRPKKRNG